MPTIAILGASADRRKFGNKAVRAFHSQGYQVFPVNPKGGTIEGLTVYRSIDAVPAPALDLVSIYLDPEVGLQVIGAVAKKKIGEVWLNPGAESPALIARAQQLGLNVIAACSLVGHGLRPSDF